MSIPTVTYDQIIALLAELGLRRGDNVMVHAALQFLGQPEGGVDTYLRALSATIGLPDEGTLVVPTFNFGFAHGQPFDQDATPSVDMGALAEHIRTRPGALRSTHPMQSIAALGRHARDLTGRDTPCAFDPGSAFDRMHELDFRLLLLGAGVQFTSLIHYCEQRVGVPYRFFKDLPGQVRLSHPMPFEGRRVYRIYARDLGIDPQVNASPVQPELERRGQWTSRRLNFGQVAICRFSDFVRAAEDLLRADPWALVENRPAGTQVRAPQTER